MSQKNKNQANHLSHVMSSIQSKRFILLVAIPSLIILTALICYALSGRYVETDNAYVKAEKIPVSSQISGVIKEVLVKENQDVKANQILYRIDPEPFQVALAKAESNLAQVRINIMAMKASYLEKQAEVALAKTKYNFSLRNKQRQTDLAARHFASVSSLDDAKETSEIAAKQIVTITHDLERLAATLGGNVDQRIEMHPSYMAAQAELKQAKLNLAHTEIRAPIAGTISSPPKIGQYITVGTISMTLVANDHPWLEANFTEKDLTHVRPGQKVEATIDIYPGITWQGQVESLSPATGAEFSLIPAQNASGNWVKIAQRIAVRIQLKQRTNAPPLRSGLSSWVKIDTKPQHKTT